MVLLTETSGSSAGSLVVGKTWSQTDWVWPWASHFPFLGFTLFIHGKDEILNSWVQWDNLPMALGMLRALWSITSDKAPLGLAPAPLGGAGEA